MIILLRRNKGRKKIFIVLLVVISISIFISIGYAYLSRDLSMAINVKIKTSNLYNKIIKYAVMDNKKSKYVTSSTGIDFSQVSSDTNGKGIYMLSSTKNDDYPIYYYRGAVENNNVLFANFCWKIVRTTETGGIKLIYNGVPDSNGACNSTGDASTIGKSEFNTNYKDNAYAGYMYGTPGSSTYSETHKNTNDSDVKKKIDTWYKNNMIYYTSMLEDTVWCNDRSLNSGVGFGTNSTNYGAYGRLVTNKTPSLKCKNLNDRFTVNTSNGNGALTYPVAMLTADEVVYAGVIYGGARNTTCYLEIGGTSTGVTDDWTLTPYDIYYIGIRFFGFRSLGDIEYSDSGYMYRVRPSISLKSDTEITSGDGTASSPYVVKYEEKPKLYDEIKKMAVADNVASEFVTSRINFSQISSDTNGKGVYMLSSTKNNTNPIYYYRGAVENNNVKFANFCWKIVRTTETGGIKLIYNGFPDSNGACNNTSLASAIETTSFGLSQYNAFVGYMYGTPKSSTYEETHKNTNDSNVKNIIDRWYKNNMTDYTSMLEDTVWCNDRSLSSGTGVGTTKTMYGAYNRLERRNTPSLECKNTNDRFTVSSENGNGALTYPVALLTADEASYAGGVVNKENSTYYLYTGSLYWLLTPNSVSDRGAFMFCLHDTGYIANISSNYLHGGVRPAISLAPGTKIADGDGSVNSPYVVQ